MNKIGLTVPYMRILVNAFAVGLVIFPFVVGAAAVLDVPPFRDKAGHLDLVVSAQRLEASADQPGRSSAEGERVIRGNWVIQGRVFHEDGPAEKATVWAIAEYGRNRQSPEPATTNENGKFELEERLPGELASSRAGGVAELSAVTVFASCQKQPGEKQCSKKQSGEKQPGVILKGKEVISIGKAPNRAVPVQLSGGPLILIPVIFVVSVLLALIDQQNNTVLRGIKYYGAIILTAGFAFGLIGYIAGGLQYVNSTPSRGDVLSLGFGHFFFGTYSDTVRPEWILSLTFPDFTPVAPEVPQFFFAVSNGFGAPLWVVFLAVLGAAIFTISVLVYEIRSPVSLNKIEEVRDSLHVFVRHQFYILFSPLGAIVVYQMMVMAGAANEQITVGVAALAAGLGLNLILDKSWKTVEGFVSDTRSPPSGGVPAASGRGGGETG